MPPQTYKREKEEEFDKNVFRKVACRERSVFDRKVQERKLLLFKIAKFYIPYLGTMSSCYSVNKWLHTLMPF